MPSNPIEKHTLIRILSVMTYRYAYVITYMYRILYGAVWLF